ncbi:MAG: 1-deoxy-D-xylulose-5-phosphate synthase [Clostridia bacterium]|nr:1-deoxy-D-xylulose-5-phosphate synthase [Clostridia bacterium]
MDDLKLLSNIKKPTDIKKLSDDQLNELADEIRQTLINTVSETGGHLASNLGVVELTIALHKVFNSPHDKIVWDVGHQVYVHKLLTGRYDKFSTLRQYGGLSGFSSPDESNHDTFFSGHSSTSISAAYGIASANKLKGNKNSAIAVIGDGAFTGGMVYEALNNAGRERSRLIVILNDNDMSISKNVGSLATHLAVIKARPSYFRMKDRTERIINRIPLVGVKLSNSIFKLKTSVKRALYKSSTMFEDLGFRYMGPIDGHNIEILTDALEAAKGANYPILLHIKTTKGKGYNFAELEPSVFHGISKFDIDTGEFHATGTSFSNEFGKLMCHFAGNDKRVCAVTAAMSLGTGLHDFEHQFPDRFFDVGIAEEHAVTFCGGLAKGGMLPVFAVYSAFLQRSYDQLVHDAALQKLKMIIAIDRAGFVTGDGETHHGLLDVPFLNTIPGITVYSPTYYAEMNNAFVKALYHDPAVVAVRMFKGAEPEIPSDFTPSGNDYDVYGDNNADVAIVTYGRLFDAAAKAKGILAANNINIKVIKLNKIKPVNKQAVNNVLNCKTVVFYEEGELNGGVAQIFNMMLTDLSYKGRYLIKAVENEFVHHATDKILLKEYGFDEKSMAEFITEVTTNER